LTAVGIGVAIAAATYLIRVLPRIGLPDYGADAYFHLTLADVIRAERDRQKFVRFFTFGKYNDYPLLLHYILSIIPKNMLEKANGLISPAFESMNAAFLYAVCLVMTGDWRLGAAACAFYIASPQLSTESLSLTPRLLGLFFFNVHFAGMIICVLNHSAIWGAIAVLAGVLCFYTTRAQLPFMVAGGILLWAFSKSHCFLTIEAAAFVISFILNPKHFMKTFKSYWNMTTDNGLHWRVFGEERARLMGEGGTTGSPLKRLAGIAKEELKMLFSYNPAVWISAAAGIYIIHRRSGLLPHPAVVMLSVWLFMVFVIFVLAERFPVLGQRVGEGYRQYPEYGAVPGAMLGAIALFAAFKNNKPFFYAVLFMLVCALLLALRIATPGFRKKMKVSTAWITPELKEILKRFGDLPFGTVMCVPLWLNYPTMYFARKRIVGIIEHSVPYGAYYRKYYGNRKCSLAESIKEFGLDYFLVHSEKQDVDQMSALGEQIDKEGPYVLLKVRPELKESTGVYT